MEIVELNLQELLKILNKLDIGLIVTMVTAIDQVLKFIALWRVRLREKKYWRIIKSIILEKTRDESINKFGRRILHYWLDMVVFPISLILFYLICNILILFLKIRQGSFQDNVGVYMIWGILGGGLVIISLLRKVPRISRWCLFIVVENLFLLLLGSMLCESKEGFSVLLGFSTLTCIIAVGLFLNRVVFVGQYRNLFTCFSEVIRYIFLLPLCAPCVWNNGKIYTYAQIAFTAWIILCTIEYLCKIFFDNSDLAVVVMHINGRDVEVRGDIVKCEGNTAMFAMKSGIHKFVNIEEIDYISYEIHNYWRKRKKGNKNVICILKDGTQRYYQCYGSANGEWMYFKNENDGCCEVHMYHIDKIDKCGQYLVEDSGISGT